MADGPSHSAEFPVGIDPAHLGSATREVGNEEAPPLAPNATLAWIGKSGLSA